MPMQCLNLNLVLIAAEHAYRTLYRTLQNVQKLMFETGKISVSWPVELAKAVTTKKNRNKNRSLLVKNLPTAINQIVKINAQH